jgi:hypothetical protein
MTEEHLSALLAAAEAKKDDDGFVRAAEGRTITLYLATASASLSVIKVEAVKIDKGLLRARTSKGELFIVELKDVYAGSIDTTGASVRKAGFV